MMKQTTPYFGAIEAGGTKFICAVGSGPDDLQDRVVIPTRGPDQTLNHVISYFEDRARDRGVASVIGIGCFGPVDINASSGNYGRIIATPKAGWSGVNLVERISDALGVPIAIDTDVNCALLAEASEGAGAGIDDVIYLTIGTGIGGGVMSGGSIVYGTGHTEIGHMFVPKQWDDQEFEGACPYHRDQCIEGLASGPAIQKRWGRTAHELPEDHEAWDLQARYLAILCHNLLMTTASRKIILGGGVMTQTHLFPKIRNKLQNFINGYGSTAEIGDDLNSIICEPALQGRAGIIGAIKIAQQFNLQTTRKLKA